MKKFRQPDSYSYKIEIIDGKEHFTVSFKDGVGLKHEISINRDTFINLKNLKLQENREEYKAELYISHFISGKSDDDISSISFEPLPNVEDVILEHELQATLIKALASLTDTERHRFLMYAVDNLSISEIARQENCTFRAINKSIKTARLKLKNILKEFSD